MAKLSSGARGRRPRQEGGGGGGGGPPPATTFHYYNQKAKRPSGARGRCGMAGRIHATNAFPPAEGQPAGEVQGGQPPRPILFYYYHY